MDPKQIAAMHEAVNKRHAKGVHIKVSVEPLKDGEAPSDSDDAHADMEHLRQDMKNPEGSPSEEAAESPMEEAKEKAMGLDKASQKPNKPSSPLDHLTAGMRPVDEEQLMSKEPHGLHERVVKHALMKKKGKH